MTTYDTPEAIAITDKAARELLEVEKLKAINSKLLEALQWYVENDDVILEMPGNEFYAEGYHKAKAAIAKALGSKA